jgi:hypothetical protein
VTPKAGDDRRPKEAHGGAVDVYANAVVARVGAWKGRSPARLGQLG